MGMDLKSVNLLSLQTSLMKQDKTTKAFCAALQPQFQQLADEIKSCIIYSRISELDHSALDELAWQMHVDWYDANAELTVKRNLIKNSLAVHMKRGTPYAVELVVKDYFNYGKVQEWFEYGGEPYHFRVVATSGDVSDPDKLHQLTKAINFSKNLRSFFEGYAIYGRHEALRSFKHQELQAFTHQQLGSGNPL